MDLFNTIPTGNAPIMLRYLLFFVSISVCIAAFAYTIEERAIQEIIYWEPLHKNILTAALVISIVVAPILPPANKIFSGLLFIGMQACLLSIIYIDYYNINGDKHAPAIAGLVFASLTLLSYLWDRNPTLKNLLKKRRKKSKNTDWTSTGNWDNSVGNVGSNTSYGGDVGITTRTYGSYSGVVDPEWY